MDIEGIKKVLPHREPMLLVEEVEMTPEGTALGRYRVRGDEWFLQGHFPGNPVVPGVILCEMMAQVCCAFLAERVQGKTPYFTGLDQVRFRQPVKPGDQLEFECALVKEKKPFYFAEGKGKVNGKMVVSAAFSFALVEA